jgi:hypothetical protein
MKGSVGLLRREAGIPLVSLTYEAKVDAGSFGTHRIVMRIPSKEVWLEDQNGNEVFSTMISARFGSFTQRLKVASGSEEEITFCFGAMGRYIEMHGNRTRATLMLEGSRRRFIFQDMEFWHCDYQSVIHFQCPEARFVTAALIAFCLFNDISDENSG